MPARVFETVLDAEDVEAAVSFYGAAGAGHVAFAVRPGSLDEWSDQLAARWPS